MKHELDFKTTQNKTKFNFVRRKKQEAFHKLEQENDSDTSSGIRSLQTVCGGNAANSLFEEYGEQWLEEYFYEWLEEHFEE